MAAVTIPYLIATCCGPKTWMTPVLALVLFVFQPDVYSLIAILGGNIATLLYTVLLGAGLPGLRSNRWGWMYAAVILASWVKPSYLPWLLVPLLCGRGQRWWSLLAAAVTGVGYLVQKMAMPVAYAQFQRAVATSSYTREAGLGIYALVLKLAQKVPGMSVAGHMETATAVHLLAMGLVLGAMLSARARGRAEGARHLWVPLVIVLAIVINPRMMEYDADVAIPFAVYLWVECLLPMVRTRGKALYLAVPMALFATLLSKDPHAAMALFLLGALVVGSGRFLMAEWRGGSGSRSRAGVTE